jgi:hypothetical protein
MTNVHVLACHSFSPNSCWWWNIFTVSLTLLHLYSFWQFLIFIMQHVFSNCHDFWLPCGKQKNSSLYLVRAWCEHGKIIEINVLKNLNPQFLRFICLTISTLVVRAGPRHAGTLGRQAPSSQCSLNFCRVGHGWRVFLKACPNCRWFLEKLSLHVATWVY